MSEALGPLERVVTALRKLPGIGPRSAERIAFHLLRSSQEDVRALGKAVLELKTKIRRCESCANLSDQALCAVCRDTRRDHQLVCVVEEPKDVLAIEKTGSYRGMYHVLMGVLSPLDGIGPESLTVDTLLRRLQQRQVQEIIIATDADMEGEATAHYLVEQLRPLGVRLTRIASGIPVGGNLEYADQATLTRALEARRDA